MNEPEQLSLEQLYECPTCHGTGVDPRDSPVLVDERVPCLTCYGSGHVTYDPNDHTIPF